MDLQMVITYEQIIKCNYSLMQLNPALVIFTDSHIFNPLLTNNVITTFSPTTTILRVGCEQWMLETLFHFKYGEK